MMLSTLLRASVDGAAIVAVAWLLCRMLPRLSPAARTILWWCAATKFVLALVWIAPVQVPILPPTESAVASTAIGVVRAPLEPAPAIATVVPQSADLRDRGLWSAGIAGIWILGVVLAIAIGLRRWRLTRAVVRQSQAAPDRIRDVAADLAARLGIRRMPDVRMSTQVNAPVVTGFLEPVVILPIDGFPALTDRQQQMAICHELTHIKRADLRLGCLPALAERMFFFHPLAHLAAREYALWREAACDAAVLRTLDASPAEYGELLIGLGVSGRRTGLVAAGAPWSFGNLKRRLVMLRYPPAQSTTSRMIAAIAVALAFATMVPVQLTARPGPVAQPTPAVPAPPTSLAQPFLTPMPHRAEIERFLSQDLAPGQDRGQQSDLDYVMFLDDDHTVTSASTADIERARTFKRPGEQVLWFRQRGAEYVVRDPAVLREVEELWKSVNRIGERQGQLGLEQEKLSLTQNADAMREDQIQTARAAMAARQADLEQLRQVLAALEKGRELDTVSREVGKLDQREAALQLRTLAQLRLEQSALQLRLKDLQAREFYVQSLELAQRLEVLQKHLHEADVRMRLEVDKARAGMRTLIERAVRSGAAEVVK